MFADSTWYLIKWAWGTVLCAYLIVQVLAVRRSTGDFKKRSEAALVGMVVATTIQSWIQSAFENRVASRISMLAVGVFAAAATIYLVSLLRSRKSVSGGQHQVEDRIQPLKLN